MRVQEILSGYPHATRPRIRAQEVVFRVQAPPVLPYGTPRPKGGMGTVQSKGRAAYLRQLPVACTPERVNGGGVGLQGWQRPEEPVAQQRKRTPIEAQERDRWLAGYRGACASQPACPAPLVVPLAAREGARQAWLVDTRRREPPQRAAGRSRAQGHRRRAPGAAQRYGWAERQPTPALGPLPLARARQPDRPPRQGTRAVTAPPVTWHGARRREANCRPARAAPSRPRSPAPPRRSPRCVVTPDQPAGEGLCQCVHGGALVALSVGNRMLFPGAEARVSE